MPELTDATAAEIRRQVAAGRPRYEIAAALGTTPWFLRRWCRELGLPAGQGGRRAGADYDRPANELAQRRRARAEARVLAYLEARDLMGAGPALTSQVWGAMRYLPGALRGRRYRTPESARHILLDLEAAGVVRRAGYLGRSPLWELVGVRRG